MTLNPNAYRTALDAMRPDLIRPGATPAYRVSEAAVLSHVPVVAVALYALRPDVLGELPELRSIVTRLTPLYDYDRIVEWIR